MSNAPAESVSGNLEVGTTPPVPKSIKMPEAPDFEFWAEDLADKYPRLVEAAIGGTTRDTRQYMSLHACDLFVHWKVNDSEDYQRKFQTARSVFIRLKAGNESTECEAKDMLGGKEGERRRDLVARWMAPTKEQASPIGKAADSNGCAISPDAKSFIGRLALARTQIVSRDPQIEPDPRAVRIVWEVAREVLRDRDQQRREPQDFGIKRDAL
ncbi:hypothetical protein PG993_005603 [Apiospora rasikravindrae]|uniref:Uncharacterized protein n=1 Tax=Apiospora rasikravindrae TaxID=990691 RepID=A0ABR1TG22_9PEZI